MDPMGTSNHFNFYWRKTVDWWLLPTLKKAVSPGLFSPINQSLYYSVSSNTAWEIPELAMEVSMGKSSG